MEPSGPGRRRLADIGLVVLLVLAVTLSVLAVRHVRSSPVAAEAATGGALTASPAPAGAGSPAPASSAPGSGPSSSTPALTPASPLLTTQAASALPTRVLLIVGDSTTANTWAGNVTATGWPAMVAAQGNWRIIRVRSLGYSTDAAPSSNASPSASAGPSPRPGKPTAPLPADIQPDGVLVLTSPADDRLTPAALSSAATTLWARLRLAYPQARIVALGPVPGTAKASSPAQETAAADALAASIAGSTVAYADVQLLAGAGPITEARLAQLIVGDLGFRPPVK